MKSEERVPTVIKFYFNEREQDLFALFVHSDEGRGHKLCYSHIGQHCGCCIEYVNESRPATKEEYKDLLEELTSIGYDVLIPQKSDAVDLLYDIVLENYMRLCQGNIAEELWTPKLVELQGTMSDTLDMVDIGFSRNPPDSSYSEELLEQRFSITEQESRELLANLLISHTNYFKNI
jgi:hypothetical protein